MISVKMDGWSRTGTETKRIVFIVEFDDTEECNSLYTEALNNIEESIIGYGTLIETLVFSKE